jgi:RluA family pseudouridine synthase
VSDDLDLQSLILWQDKALVAINKPSGLLSIADGYQPDLPHAAQWLTDYLGKVWVIHRLDKETSGVLLFALTAEAHQSLNIQFQKRETRKEYHALVVGNPEWDHQCITLPLKVNGDRGHRTIVDTAAGKPAETEIVVRQQYQGFCSVGALPRTGYTHQIRAHLAAVGLPILCDPLYKSRQPETLSQQIARKILPGLPIHRTALHAYQISFRHPTSGETITIQAREPQDFINTLQTLASHTTSSS